MGFPFTNIAATTAAVDNRFVASANMKVGDYTLANTTPVWQGGALVTVTHTQVGGVTDTLGTIVVVGKDLSGQTRTEIITPLSGTVATGTIPFRTITSITGVDWVIDTGNDTIKVGVAAGCIVVGGNGTLHGIVINTAAAAAVVISDASRTIATIPSNQAAGTFFLYDVDFAGFLKVATTSTNDLTVMHSGTSPTAYALA
jgi:hypothetical protein